MATFGELMVAADEHLAEVAGTLRNPDIPEQAAHPATSAELARMATILGRYADRLATAFGTRDDHSGGLRDASRRVGDMLDQARRLLGTPTWTGPDRPPLAWLLHATGNTLGCGLDLLASHTTTQPQHSPGATTTGNAAVVTATDTTRWLLHTLSEHTAVIGNIALRAAPPGQQAGTLLLKAALVARVYGHRASTPITALPLNTLPARIAPQPDEDTMQATAAIGGSAARLSVACTDGSVTTWQYLAIAAVITHDVGAVLAQQLSRRLKQLDHHGHAQDFLTAAEAIRGLAQRWKTIAKSWHALAPDLGRPTAGPALDAGDLVIRLGRLAHADPNWTPTARANQHIRPPEQLVPTLAEAGLIGTAVLKAIEACRAVADNHRAAVNDIAILGGLRDPIQRGDRPYRPPHHVRQLLARYQQISTKSRDAITRLGHALEKFPELPPSLAEETALILRRNTGAADPAAVAAADFPIPLPDALNATATSRERPGQRPNTSPAEPPKRRPVR